MKFFLSFSFGLISITLMVNVLNAQWIQTNGPPTEVTLTLAVGVNDKGDTNIYAGTYLGGVFLSTDYGNNWMEIDGGNFSMGDTGFTRKDIRALAVTQNGTGGMSLFAGTMGNGVFLSANADTNWVAINNGLIDLDIYAIVINSDSAGNAKLYAGTGSGVFLSTNSGANWSAVDTELRGYWGFVIGRNAAGDTILFKLDDYSGILRSTDNGANWVAIKPNLPDQAIVRCLAVHDTIVYAGTNGYGVYYSWDCGINWGGSNGGLGSVGTLAVGGSYLFAGVGIPFSSCSVWRRPLSEMMTGVEKMISTIPQTFELMQNYPNPFNPTTVISYQISAVSNVSLKVYDILGREVATLVNEEKEAGTYNTEWNAIGIPSGLYFYRLNVHSHDEQIFSQVKKMLLMK